MNENSVTQNVSILISTDIKLYSADDASMDRLPGTVAFAFGRRLSAYISLPFKSVGS
jgi:hypothetical protein